MFGKGFFIFSTTAVLYGYASNTVQFWKNFPTPNEGSVSGVIVNVTVILFQRPEKKIANFSQIQG